MNDPKPTMRISGYCHSDAGRLDFTRVAHVRLYIDLDTPEQAVDLAARFPKAAKVHGGPCSGWGPNGALPTTGLISGYAILEANGVNGGVNETGLKRYRTWLAAAEKLGLEIDWRGDAAGNAYPTQADFEVAAGLAGRSAR